MLDHADSQLISSDRVNGTEVFGAGSARIGHIDHLLIDRNSGKIAYAVMGFGGLLGMGEEHHPIPWSALKYDMDLGGYVTGITEDQLRSAPARRDDWREDAGWRESVYSHYGAPIYWA